MRAASRNWTQIVGAAAALFALVAGTVLTSTARVQAQDAAGGSVWAGVYTEEQAKRGEAVVLGVGGVSREFASSRLTKQDAAHGFRGCRE